MTERVPIFAAAGLLAALALGGGFFLLGRGHGTTDASANAPVAPVAHVRAHAAEHRNVEASRKLRPKKRATPAVIDGMPGTLALALRANPVVVVSLYASDSSIDGLAKEEARQGAALSGAAFVALDVSKEKVAHPLTSLLTTGPTPADKILDDPAVLVFRSPEALFVRLNGWTDRELVAQAVENARTTAP
jgi:hypothetical protein